MRTHDIVHERVGSYFSPVCEARGLSAPHVPTEQEDVGLVEGDPHFYLRKTTGENQNVFHKLVDTPLVQDMYSEQTRLIEMHDTFFSIFCSRTTQILIISGQTAGREVEVGVG